MNPTNTPQEPHKQVDGDVEFSIKLQEATANTDMTDVQFIKMLKLVEDHAQSKLKAFAGEVLDIVEAEYQKCSTVGRINEDGYRKLYVQSEYRHNVVKAIKKKAGIE
jgi:hypothetical protein